LRRKQIKENCALSAEQFRVLMRLPKRKNNIGQCRNPHVFGIIYRRQYSERRKITTIILFAKEPSSTKAYGEGYS
jgi:hypothetical protein